MRLDTSVAFHVKPVVQHGGAQAVDKDLRGSTGWANAQRRRRRRYGGKEDGGSKINKEEATGDGAQWDDWCAG